jgi:hypothetical protein
MDFPLNLQKKLKALTANSLMVLSNNETSDMPVFTSQICFPLISFPGSAPFALPFSETTWPFFIVAI